MVWKTSRCSVPSRSTSILDAFDRRLVAEMKDLKAFRSSHQTRSNAGSLRIEQQFPSAEKTLRSSDNDVAPSSRRITVREVSRLHELAHRQQVRVLDVYSVKPIDVAQLQSAEKHTLVVVKIIGEGGIGEAVRRLDRSAG
jgi:transketolase